MRHVIRAEDGEIGLQIGTALRNAWPGDKIVVPNSYAETLATVGKMQIGALDPARGKELDEVKIVVEAP